MTAARDDADRAGLVALAMLPGVGPATLAQCHRTIGGDAAWRAIVAGAIGTLPMFQRVPGAATAAKSLADWHDRLAHAARAIDPTVALARHRDAGVQVVVEGDADYPERLVDDPAPACLLFVRGGLDLLGGPTVALVGTRNATRLGCDTAAQLGAELCTAGVHVVSGLALGIDGAAHRGVLDRLVEGGVARAGHGAPIGVVAAGLDRPYPRRHAELHRSVAAHGVLLGETPFGMDPHRWRFPARNRVIAGLADAVVVVESRSAGGSMLTAAEALARDVPVLAVPGHPRSPASAGALDLVFDGAAPVRDVDDILVAIGLGGRAKPPPVVDPLAALPEAIRPEAGAVLGILEGGPATLDDLVVAVDAGLGEVAAAVSALERSGAVVRTSGWFERTATGHAARAAGERS